MCIICTGDYDESLTVLDCHWCSEITEIPKALIELTKLYCYRTKVTTIPYTLTNLTTLDCRYTKVTTIPNSLIELTRLNCYGTKMTTIPDTLVNLEHHLPKHNVKLLKKFQKTCKLRRITKSNILFVMHQDLVRHIIAPML